MNKRRKIKIYNQDESSIGAVLNFKQNNNNNENKKNCSKPKIKHLILDSTRIKADIF